jgi:hypothetical protein
MFATRFHQDPQTCHMIMLVYGKSTSNATDPRVQFETAHQFVASCHVFGRGRVFLMPGAWLVREMVSGPCFGCHCDPLVKS